MSRLRCPCCGLPTLTARAAFEVCPVCLWEDDGQGEADAGEPNGGPNGDVSLAEARANFAARGNMYREGEEIALVARPSPARRAMLAHLARPDRGEDDFGELLAALERTL